MESNSIIKNKRPHLTKEKRIPQCYRDVARALKVVKSCKGNLKTVLYNTKLRGAHLQKVQALASNVLKHYRVLTKVIEDVDLLKKEPYLLREYAEIMVYELLFGKGSLVGKSKPVLTVLNYQQDIMKAFQSLDSKEASETGLCSLPRWVRVNTLVTTITSILEELHELGYQEVDCNIQSQEQYLDLVKSLKSPQFLVDHHFKDMLVFASGENLCQLKMYQKGKIALQDKSSYIPVQVLNPEPGSIVLDACAAPGMKTIHIASVMQDQGVLYAFERDEGRFATLKNMVNKHNIKMCKTFHQDFKSADPSNHLNSEVQYILLDPSCSGSGMVSRMDEVTDLPDSKTKSRLQKLAGFQIILLKHALKFPSVQRVVYSTCSIHEEENEFVVHEALEAFRDKFRLVPVLPDWSARGLDTYEFGTLCLRSFPEKNLTNGFFVAAFERVDSSSDEWAMNRYARGDSLGKDRCFTELSDGKRTKKKRRRESNTVDNEHNTTGNNVSNLLPNLSYEDAGIGDNCLKKQKRKKQKTDHHRSEGMQKHLGPLASDWGSKEASSDIKDDANLCLNLDLRAISEDMNQKCAQQTETENKPFCDEYSVKKKKKHKRKHDDNECLMENIVDDTPETNNNLIECFDLVKKHEKKNKQKIYDQHEDETKTEFESEHVCDEYSVKKKKKKHKRKHDGHERLTENIFDDTQETNHDLIECLDLMRNKEKKYNQHENKSVECSGWLDSKKKHKKKKETQDGIDLHILHQEIENSE